jgi:hypothetical protein
MVYPKGDSYAKEFMDSMQEQSPAATDKQIENFFSMQDMGSYTLLDEKPGKTSKSITDTITKPKEEEDMFPRFGGGQTERTIPIEIPSFIPTVVPKQIPKEVPLEIPLNIPPPPPPMTIPKAPPLLFSFGGVGSKDDNGFGGGIIPGLTKWRTPELIFKTKKGEEEEFFFGKSSKKRKSFF